MWSPPRAYDGLVLLGDKAFDVLIDLVVLLWSGLGRVEPVLLELFAGQVFGVAAQQDIDAAARHVGGDGHGVEPSGLGYDLGFHFVVLGVEDDVADALLAQEIAQMFRFLDGYRADQDRAAGLVELDYLLSGRRPLLSGRPVDDIGVLDADEVLVGRLSRPRPGRI